MNYTVRCSLFLEELGHYSFTFPAGWWWVLTNQCKLIFFFSVLVSALCLSVIHNKDLLATIHLLVAMVKCFQPEMELPPNVKVEVVAVEVSFSSSFSTFFLLQISLQHIVWKLLFFFFSLTSIYIQVSSSGIKSDIQTEVLTEDRWVNCFHVFFCEYVEKVHLVCFWPPTATQAQTATTVKVSKSALMLGQCDILNVAQYSVQWLNIPLWLSDHPEADPIEQLLKLEPHKVNTVKKVWRGVEQGAEVV